MEAQAQAARRRWPLAAGALAALALLAGYALLFAAPFRLQRVEVTGNRHVPASRIRELAGVAPGDLRWRHPPAAVAQRILQEPWVASAQVEWRPGGVLAIQVTERQPVALLPYYNAYAVLDAQGTVLAVVSLTDFRLPVVTGIPLARALRGDVVADGRLGGALQVIGLLPPDTLAALSEVAVGPAGDLTLWLEGPVAVVLGPPDRLEEKVLAALARDSATGRTLVEQARLTAQNLDVRNPQKPTLVPRHR